MTDCCCFWKMVLWQSVLVWSFGTLGWSQLISCFNTEYRWAFLRLRFLAGGAIWQDSGCSIESIRVVWSVSPAWEAVEVTLGGCLHLPVRGLRSYRFGSDNCGCSRKNAWQFSTFPLPGFWMKSQAGHLWEISGPCFFMVAGHILLWLVSLVSSHLYSNESSDVSYAKATVSSYFNISNILIFEYFDFLSLQRERRRI